MNFDRTADLCSRFPLVTRELYVLECGDGWHLLLRHALGQLERIAARDAAAGNKPLLVVRVREDHGCLEIVTKGIDDEIFDVVNSAYQASRNVCEKCGCAAEWKYGGGGYSRSRCDSCG